MHSDDLDQYDKMELDDRSNSITYLSTPKVDINVIGSDDIQRFQNRERIKLIIEQFEEIKCEIDYKYRNCVEAISQSILKPNSIVIYAGAENYRILLLENDVCHIHKLGKLIKINVSEVSLQFVQLEDTHILKVFRLIYQDIDKNLFDIVKFFTTFAEVFNLDYKILYDNIPYTYQEKLREIMKSKSKNEGLGDNVSLW